MTNSSKRPHTAILASSSASFPSTNHAFRASRAACVRLGTKRFIASSRLAQRVTSSSSARQGRLGTRLAPGVSVQSRLSGSVTDGIFRIWATINYAEFLKPCVFCLNVYFSSFLVVLWVSLLFLLARSAIPLQIMSTVGFEEDALISTRST